MTKVPVHIAMIFRDSLNIYLEIPGMKDGPPGWVRKFPIQEGGLSLIKLRDIPDISEHPGYTKIAPRFLDPPAKLRTAKTRRKPNKYPKQEAKAFMQRWHLQPKAK